MSVNYHQCQVNVVSDALCRLSMGSVDHVEEERQDLVNNVHMLDWFGVRLISIADSDVTVQNGAVSSVVVEANENNDSDPIFPEPKNDVHNQRVEVFSQGGDGVLPYQGRLCLPDISKLIQNILSEDHKSRYSIHPGSTKMYHDLRVVYWWNGMKRDIAGFMSKCPNCQQVKV